VLAAGARAVGEPSRRPIFEWCETAPPHARTPAADRARALAEGKEASAPALVSARSCDLHPASWFSVAWYPLYALPPPPPGGARARARRAGVLTFHSFHPHAPPRASQPTPPSLGGAADAVAAGRAAAGAAGDGRAATLLPAWGLARYRAAGPAWADPGLEPTYAAMEGAAREWVARRRASHADAAFFAADAARG